MKLAAPTVTVFSAMVRRSSSRVWKLCAGSALRASFLVVLLRGFDHGGSPGFAGGGLGIVEQHRRQGAAHVPLDVIGEHAQEYTRPHPILEAVMNRARTLRSTLFKLRKARSTFDSCL